MTATKDIRPVLEAMEQINDALPADPGIAFEALSFAIIEAAVDLEISREDLHANIDQLLDARLAAARQMMS
ncbi:MAG TPA: hypothetical protein VFY63_06325 [Pseudorhizobium sp.]|nr:hypothetical protein [Pseudorhizobium sp.]